MDTLSRSPVPANGKPQWRTEDYRGKQIHVCAKLRPPQNDAYSGEDFQWAFTVKITEPNLRLLTTKSSTADSDPGLLYLTQAIAEDMGFAKGRELIEGT